MEGANQTAPKESGNSKVATTTSAVVSFILIFSTSLWSIRGGRFTPKNWNNTTNKWRQLVAKLVTNAQLYFTSPFGQFLPVGV